MYPIRPFNPTNAEYEAIVDLVNAVSPENPASLEGVKHQDSIRETQYLFKRDVIELDQKIVGLATYGESTWSYEPGKYFIGIDVHPSYRHRGIGMTLYDHILAFLNQRDPKPRLLTAGTRESKTNAVRFLEKRGFEKVMHWVISYLDVTTFDPVKFASFESRVAKQNITLHSFAELEAEDQASNRRKYYDLVTICGADEPNPSSLKMPTFEVFSRQEFDNPNFHAEDLFIALDGDQFVGMAGIERNPEIEHECGAAFAGVLRSHRRRGIAAALKLRAINHARELGKTRLKTGNEKNNPILALNVKLGFKPEDASLAFEKEMV